MWINVEIERIKKSEKNDKDIIHDKRLEKLKNEKVNDSDFQAGTSSLILII